MHNVFMNSGFLIGFLALFLCLLAHSISVHQGAIQEPIIEYRPSAMIYSFQGIFFGGYIQLFPLVACLPGYVLRRRATYTEENIQNRKTRNHNILVYFIAGALVCTLPYTIHTIFWNIVAIPVNPALYPEHEMSFWGIYNDLYSQSGGFWMYLIIAFGMILLGGFYSLFYLVVSEFMRASASALIIPTLFYHVWLRFGVLLEEYGMPLSPYLISNDAITVEEIIVSVIIHFIMINLLIFVYHKKRSVL